MRIIEKINGLANRALSDNHPAPTLVQISHDTVAQDPNHDRENLRRIAEIKKQQKPH